MELRGLEPLTYALPARRSGQLSYSPVECEVVCKVNACPLSVVRRSQPQTKRRIARKPWSRQQRASVHVAAMDREQLDLILGIRAEHVAP